MLGRILGMVLLLVLSGFGVLKDVLRIQERAVPTVVAQHQKKKQDSCDNRQERRRIMERAQKWLDADISYNFMAFVNGYRTQCSGFLAAAWNLTNPSPTQTPRCFNLEARGHAHVISKEEIQQGDAMVCNALKYDPWQHKAKQPGQQGGGHCLLFERWTNDSQTAYIGWELCSDAHCTGITRREIPYPYFYKTSCWEPMRRSDLFDDSSC